MSATESANSAWKLSEEEGGILAGRWWKWAVSTPDDRCPVRDTTGEHAAWKQPADLWFLAGTYGGRVERRCDVDARRPHFFPVLNMRSPAKDRQNMAVAHAEASLNGIPLPLREFSGFFRAGLVRSFAWGVWGGLAPLAPGQYVLEISGRSSNGFWVDTTYHLNAQAQSAIPGRCHA
ncbi:hypothetical protein OG783_03455 [Streptomyces jietaisiensis]|uniref:hypothetical protein n=1 Tax=Streptomyces griseoaurantiacus TaxID=68213 RepID=UPI0032508559